MEFIIKTTNLDFQYSKNKKILNNLSINVPKGSIYGFLGPNGAGKSTTMRLLTGITPDDSNSIFLFEKSIKSQTPDVFEKVGALVESPALYLHLSGYDNVKYIALLRQVPLSRIDEVLELVDLTAHKKQKAKQYSLGMKQRLAIAMALLSKPELLFLDEPVNGLDPNGIVEIRKLLVKINKERGVTIFVSSHLLSEIEKMCTHIGIISKGILKYEGTMEDLSRKFETCKIQITLDEAESWKEKLSSKYANVVLEEQNKITMNLSHTSEIPDFAKQIIQEGARIYEIKILEGLEEWFMNLTEN
ncbi:ATP-binding cassette domain-containing protein [Flavobacterium sp. LMO8]|uniref:ABC transporter ATP-binding protein n=1 Tax=Flavobacterium sp. LMO8 TaxID=2654244 RepID=UPI0012927656|nr:ABC transporter ATP-binding protein [Flavobacterium sp. LMO8]MQP23631.1 ATP-binding cassette domain-containing protein [Flavobacterium sp. LMO8]